MDLSKRPSSRRPSSRNFRGNWATWIALTLTAFVIAGCASAPRTDRPVSERTVPRTEQDRPLAGRTDRYDPRRFVAPLHLEGAEPVRIALLLPFTGGSDAARRVASSMFDAAQLATFEAGDDRFLLIPKDTRGTPEGAATAARAALADGAEIILGPLFAEEVASVASVARASGTPVIAFSSDMRSAGDGVFLLSFPPELEVARVAQYAMSKGMMRFGVLAPANEYGDRVTAAFGARVSDNGGIIVHQERYEQAPDAMLAPARRLAQYSREIIPAELRHRFDPGGPQSGDRAVGDVRGFQAVLMPEQGTLLRALAPLLPYYNVNINQVKLLGVSGWNNPRLTREPALRGGWFAAPDPAIAEGFNARFRASFGETPPRLASLAYDATLLSARVGQAPRRRGRLDVEAIANPNGYFGADGLFRLQPDGSVERGLAILEIQPGGIRVIEPAPRSFVAGS